MRVLTKELVKKKKKKRELETKIQTAITDFEDHFSGCITISNVDILKVKKFNGQQSTVITVSLEIA